MLLKCYHKGLLARAAGSEADWLTRLLGRALSLLGSDYQHTIKALEYHCSNYPAKDGTGFMGYLDSLSRIDAELVEIRGWLVHIEARIAALTFFSAAGAVMADYGFPRPDLVPLLPHLPQVDLSGFRVVLPAAHLIQGTRLTFQAFLADQATRFASFAIEKLPDLGQAAEGPAQHS